MLATPVTVELAHAALVLDVLPPADLHQCLLTLMPATSDLGVLLPWTLHLWDFLATAGLHHRSQHSLATLAYLAQCLGAYEC